MKRVLCYQNKKYSKMLYVYFMFNKQLFWNQQQTMIDRKYKAYQTILNMNISQTYIFSEHLI